MRQAARLAEDTLASAALIGVMLLPLGEIVARSFFSSGIQGESSFANALTLWVGMLGGAIAAREGKLLTLATGEFLPEGPISRTAHVIAGMAGAMVATVLALGGWAFVMSERSAGDMLVNVPAWVVGVVFPLAFGLIAV